MGPRQFWGIAAFVLSVSFNSSVLGQAQGTLPFAATLTATNEVPSNNDPTIGTGTFSLTGNTLGFFVNIPAVFFISVHAYIQGPAGPGTNGPIIFDLGGPGFQGGNEFGTPPSWMFSSAAPPPFWAGPYTLTLQQVRDMKKGLLYVNVTSYGLTNGQVRGQILLRPQATLNSPALANNSAQFTVSEVAGLNYVVQASTSLLATNWVAIVTNTAPFTFIDEANGPQRFYRALYSP